MSEEVIVGAGRRWTASVLIRPCLVRMLATSRSHWWVLVGARRVVRLLYAAASDAV